MKGLKPDKKHKETPSSEIPFIPSSQVKGIRVGGQFIVKSFTLRRARPPELVNILSSTAVTLECPLLSTTAFLPTRFTILAHQAWRTLTLGLGTKRSKMLLFVFDSEATKLAAEKTWPQEVPLGEVNKRFIRALAGHEMARFKFRKGCITFYVYAVRKEGAFGFSKADNLLLILQSIVSLNDFVDHTCMLAMPHQRTINAAQ